MAVRGSDNFFALGVQLLRIAIRERRVITGALLLLLQLTASRNKLPARCDVVCHAIQRYNTKALAVALRLFRGSSAASGVVWLYTKWLGASAGSAGAHLLAFSA